MQTFPSEEAVLEACGRLIDFGAWEQTKIDPQGWLGNFPADKRPFALLLLSRFTFLTDPLVDQLFRSAFHDISNHISLNCSTGAAAKTKWRAFCDEAVITLVQGEQPNPSDSGWLFARKARQTLGVSEDRLKSPSATMDMLLNGFDGPVIFVDDFVGSGEQFISTWMRPYPFGGRLFSFNSISGNTSANFFYCNAMTTSYGRERVSRTAPILTISAGNVIGARYSFVRRDSVLWPAAVCEDGIKFIRDVSRELGFVAEDGGENDWQGFHKLGLAIAFEHSTPDANLPLFFTERKGWTPLVRRV